jgi:hypothetical protein
MYTPLTPGPSPQAPLPLSTGGEGRNSVNRSPIVDITLRVMNPHAERELYYPNRS